LRGLLLALVLANLLVLTWAQGWLAPSLPGPRAGLGEPQRLANQVQPEWVRVVPAASASAGTGSGSGSVPGAGAGASADASADASAGVGARAAEIPNASQACLEAGPLGASSLAAARAALEAATLPVGRWAQTSDTDGRVWLRVDQADAGLQAKLLALPAADLAGGFKPCRVS